MSDSSEKADDLEEDLNIVKENQKNVENNEIFEYPTQYDVSQHIYDSEDPKEFAEEGSRPLTSQWTLISTLFKKKIKIMRINKTDRVYCNYWEQSFFMPVFSCIMIFYALFCFLFFTLPLLKPSTAVIAFFEVFVSLGLFLWCYFGAMCMDPGYLPFDWVYSQKCKYTPEELVSGTAVNNEQIMFGKRHKLKFASFSSSAGRYVIRADHICGWVTNWIGKRNHKQFILMNLYGSIYAISLFIWRFFMRYFPKKNTEIAIILTLFSAGIEIMFGMTLIITFFDNIMALSNNETRVSKYKGESGAGESCCESIQEVCGKGSLLDWMIPKPAFGDIIPLYE